MGLQVSGDPSLRKQGKKAWTCEGVQPGQMLLEEIELSLGSWDGATQGGVAAAERPPSHHTASSYDATFTSSFQSLVELILVCSPT